VRYISVLVLAGIALVASCTPIRSVRDRFFKSRDQRMAETTTIHRDEWGVPHILARTDAAAVFGMAYAQAEDNFWQLEEDMLRSLGMLSRVYGEAAISQDVIRAAFEVERLSREEYAREPPARRALWDAYAGGLNYYLLTHPEVKARSITRFEPWFVFARFRSIAPNTVIDSVPVRGVIASLLGTFPIPASSPGPLPAFSSPPQQGDEDEGSNAWAVAPSRTANGHALLFQNPHVGFFGSGQRWEVQLETEAGWHFSGFAILGTPMPRAGHNRQLGWTHTNTAADDADAWIVTFDHATDSLAYRYAGDWRRAVEWEDTILVANAQGMEARRYRFRKTHYGPVIRLADGKFASVRQARFEEGGSLQQWYAMGRARTLAEFKTAMAGTALSISNTMYADAEGNILYVHGNAVPKRAGAFDRTRPLDGANPETEWQGYHTLEELPQLLNPATGWLQNTNSTPFLATAEGANLKREDYPAYMAPEQDNERARASARSWRTNRSGRSRRGHARHSTRVFMKPQLTFRQS
jgi:penicillin amidase